MSKSDWTDEDVTRCRKLWADGRSASEIGREIGRGRSSVCGYVHRHRDLFPARRQADSQAEQNRRKVREAKADRRVQRPPVTTRPIVEPPTFAVVPIIDSAEPVLASDPVAFWQLTERRCKWPLWPVEENPGAFGLCCGAAKDPVDSYCRHHRLVSRGIGTRSERNAAGVLERMAS